MPGPGLFERQAEGAQIDPAELGMRGLAGLLGNPACHFGPGPEAPSGWRGRERRAQGRLLFGGERGAASARPHGVLIPDGVGPLGVIALEDGADPFPAQADQRGRFANPLARTEEPQHVPAPRFFRTAARPIARL